MAEQRFEEQIQMSPPSTKAIRQSVESGRRRLFSFGRIAYRRASRGVSQIPNVSRDMLSNVDRRAHERPWVVASIVGLGTLVLGFVLGSRIKGSRLFGREVSEENIEDYS